MKANHKDKSLAKKVLLSVVAAGVMSGFVLTAEAADIFHEDGQKHTYTAVDAGKVTAYKGSEIELSGGTITSIKEAHVDPEDDRVGYADVSAESGGAGSKIVANNADFKGEVHASTGGTIILNGGSVTSGTFYDKDGNSIEDYPTEIGSRGEGAYVELNKVKIDSNLGAFEGAELTVNDSNVNADTAIYAEGGTINLISTDGKAKYVVGEEGVWAEAGGVININGGGTFEAFDNNNLPEGYEQKGMPFVASDGGTINIDSNNNKTTIVAGLGVYDAHANIKGDVEFQDGNINVRASDSSKSSTVVTESGSKLSAADLQVFGEGSSFTANGIVDLSHIDAMSGAKVTLNGGKVDYTKEEKDDKVLPGIWWDSAALADYANLTANNVDFVGDVRAYMGGNVKLTGGSVTAGYVYENGKIIKLTGFVAEYGDEEKGSAVAEADGVKLNTNVVACHAGKVIVKNSTVDTTNEKNIYAYVKAEDEGSSVELYNTKIKTDSLIADFGGKVFVDAQSSATVDTVEATNGNIEFNGNLNANGVYASNSTINLTGGGKITGAELSTGTKVAALVMDSSTLTATNVDFTGDFKAEGGSKITLKGGSVTASDYYEDGKKDGYTEFGAVGEGSSVEADGVDIKSATLATDGAKVNIKNSSIDTVEGIWAWGKGSEIVLDGTAANVYTVGESIVANDGGKIYINGGTLKDNNLWSKMFGIEADGETINTDAKGIVLDQNGVISTMSKQIYANAATERESGEIINKGIYFKGGSLILNDAKFTQSYTDSAQAELKKQGVTKLTMNGELVKEETGEAIPEISVGDAADKFGSNTELDKTTAKADGNLLVGSNDASLAGKDVAGINVQQQVGNGFAVAKLDLKEGNGVVITNNKEVTLGGSQGDSDSIITVNGAVVDVKVVIGTTAPVAGASEINGTLNIGNNNANENISYKLHGDVEVNAGSSLNVKGQTEITKSLSLNKADVNVKKGLLQTKDLNVNDAANLLGAVNATNLNAAGAILAIGNKDGAGKLTVEKADLNGGMVFLDPAWEVSTGIENASGLAVTDVTAGLNGAYVAGQNSKLSFGADLAAADAAFARSGETWSKNGVTAGTYIASTVDVAHGSITVDGSLTAAPAASEAPAGSVKFEANSMLMVNAEAISNTQAAITGVNHSATISAESKLYLDNAVKDKTYKIIDGTAVGVAANWNVDNILSNNKLLTFEVDAATNSVKTSSQSVTAAYGDAVVAGDVYDAAILAGGAAADFVAKAADEHVNKNTATQVSAFNSAAAMGELAGVEHGTYAASNLFTDAISEHMSLTNEKEHDSDIWAKYIHSKENVDGLAVAGADSKYDVNYNGIVVGADLYKNGKATVGAALSYVDGSVKGNTLAARTENDATYYGASIYGGIQNEDSTVIGDISYLHGKNDITQHNSGMTLTADAKSDAFSIGVRAEKTLKAGIGKFVPYAGIRYMHLGTGNYNNSIGMSYDGDDMNLWLLPVGVKYSADVKAGGWTIRPIAEVGYVWNMGDRDATQTVSLNGASNGFGYDVADNGSYIGRFVVEAEKANVTYGLGYEYQKGDSVKANKWMANVNWSF